MLAHAKNAWDRWSMPILSLLMIGVIVGFLSFGFSALIPKPSVTFTATTFDQDTANRMTCAQLQRINDRSSKEALKVLSCPKT